MLLQRTSWTVSLPAILVVTDLRPALPDVHRHHLYVLNNFLCHIRTSALSVKRKLEVSFRAPPKVPTTEIITEIIEVSKFSISDMVWSPPVSAHFTIEKGAFADGGFRAALQSYVEVT